MTATLPAFAAARSGRDDPVDAPPEGIVRCPQAQGARVTGEAA